MRTPPRFWVMTSLWVAALVCGAAGDVQAQVGRIPGPPAADVSVGGGLVMGVDLGTSDANVRSNATTARDFRLFSVASTLEPAVVVEFRAAGAVSRRVAIEGQVHIGKPELRSVVTDDVEGAPDTTLSATLTQVLLAGGVRIRADDPRRPARTVPHVTAGGGVLRQSHEDSDLVDQSAVVYLGGGVRHALSVRTGGFPRAGVRADVQVLLVRGGIKLDDKMTPQLSITGGVFFAF